MNNLRNRVNLIGHLGKDPEVKEIKGGKKVAKVSIATKEVYKNNDDEKVVETQWHNLVSWGKTAESMETYLKKGKEVAIQGRLKHRSYEDKEGNTKYVSEIIVDEFMMFS